MGKRLQLRVITVITGSWLALAATLTPAAFAADQSGCVTCHTDEQKLTANLMKAETKTSAKQAGAG